MPHRQSAAERIATVRAELLERRRIGDAIMRELAEITMPSALDRLAQLAHQWRTLNRQAGIDARPQEPR